MPCYDCYCRRRTATLHWHGAYPGRKGKRKYVTLVQVSSVARVFFILPRHDLDCLCLLGRGLGEVRRFPETRFANAMLSIE